VISDFAVRSFGGAAKATQNAIDAASDLTASSFGGAANTTQMQLMHSLI
jgi:hypothetical protein